MLLSIAILALAGALTLLQFLRPSKLGWRVAILLSVALLVLSIWNAYEENNDKHFHTRSLEQIGTRINWTATDVTVDLLNDFGSIEAESVNVQLKVFSPERIQIPANKVSLGTIQASCEIDPQWGIGYLPQDIAEQIFMAFSDEHGSIEFKKESDSGIEHLLYTGKSVHSAPLGSTRVKMQLDKAPDVRSEFSSLIDLNGTFVVGLVQAVSTDSPIFSNISIELLSAAGVQRLYVPVRIIDPTSKRPILGPRFIGFCIPKEYFGVIKKSA